MPSPDALISPTAMTTVYAKTAIPCESCAKAIIKIIQPIENVKSVAVDLKLSEIIIQPANSKNINELLASISKEMEKSGRFIQDYRFD